MTAFEITIQNIQKVLDVINSGEYTAKTWIASEMKVSPTLVNKIFKRIEHEVSIVDGVYKTNVRKRKKPNFIKNSVKLSQLSFPNLRLCFGRINIYH